MWEDEANKFGGKWIVRLRKGDIHPREADRHSPWQVSVLGAGRTWYWPCSVSSSWWGRRSAALLSLSGSRRTYWGEAVWKVIHSKVFRPIFFAASGTGLHAIRPWPTGSEIHSDGFPYFMLFHISGLTVFVCSLPISPRCSVFQLARRSSTRLITTASSEFGFAQIWEFYLQKLEGCEIHGWRLSCHFWKPPSNWE